MEEWQGDMVWVHGIADFIKCLDQSVLAFRLERNVKVNSSTWWRVTEELLVGWEDIPSVLHLHIVPKWCRIHHEVGKGARESERRAL